MKRAHALAFLIPLCVFGRGLVAADDAGAKPEVVLSRLVELGPGVHAIKKDKKGRILSCVVVSQARISTALGKAKGLEVARDKANLAAAAEFVKWLKEEVTIRQTSDEETVTLIEGSEGGDNETLKESGKAIERTSKKIESISSGLVRGLQLIHKEVDADGKTYSIVKGWKADTAQGLKNIAADQASDKPGTGRTPRTADKTKLAKEIEGSKVTSDDAKDFLP